MPVLTLYRSRRTITRPDGRWDVSWEEWGFGPTPGGRWAGAGGWRNERSDPGPVRVRVPPGPIRPADAAAVYWLARRGEPGYQLLEGEDVARKRDDGPSLFGPDATPELGAYGPASRSISTLPEAMEARDADPAVRRARIRREVAAIAREVIDPVLSAVERALAQLERAIQSESGTDGVVTARAILQGALEEAGRRPAAPDGPPCPAISDRRNSPEQSRGGARGAGTSRPSTCAQTARFGRPPLPHFLQS